MIIINFDTATNLCVRFVVGRPGFDSLAVPDQNTLKVGIHSFPAIKRVNVEVGWHVRLLCP